MGFYWSYTLLLCVWLLCVLTIVGKANISVYCHRYNHLRDTIAEVERELQRLHDPLQLNLPTPAPHTASLGEHKKQISNEILYIVKFVYMIFMIEFVIILLQSDYYKHYVHIYSIIKKQGICSTISILGQLTCQLIKYLVG